MKKPLLIVSIFLLLFAAGGALLYDWVLGETQEASGPVTAVPITVTAAPSGESVRLTFEIAQTGSEARYIIFEELRGQPVDVVGTTSEVAGQFLVDLNDLSTARRLGTIQVNARTFVTDEERRDRATRNRILNTDEHEFITFTPASLEGLPASAGVGETISFIAHGELAIRDVIHPVAFDIVLTVHSPELLTGEAKTKVSRRDYGLIVPNLPFIANVADEVRLEFEGEFRLKAAETSPGEEEIAL